MSPKSESCVLLGNRGARSHASWMYQLERSSPQLKSIKDRLPTTAKHVLLSARAVARALQHMVKLGLVRVVGHFYYRKQF